METHTLWWRDPNSTGEHRQPLLYLLAFNWPNLYFFARSFPSPPLCMKPFRLKSLRVQLKPQKDMQGAKDAA